MATLIDAAEFTSNEVYQIQATDPVEGAASGASFSGTGVSNQPHQQLANRTAFLKQRQDVNISNIGVLQAFQAIVHRPMAQNGYLKIPVADINKGLIQYDHPVGRGELGREAGRRGSTVPYTFPIAFPNACEVFMPITVERRRRRGILGRLMTSRWSASATCRGVAVLGLEQQSPARFDRCAEQRLLLDRDRILRRSTRREYRWNGNGFETKDFPAFGSVTLAAMILLVVSAEARAQNLPPPGSYQPIPNFTGVGAGLQFREAINQRFSGTQPIAPSIVTPTFANLPPEQDGMLLYCQDCRSAAPCVSGGAGAWALGTRGQWACAGAALEAALNANSNKVSNLASATVNGDAIAFGQTGAQLNTLSGSKLDGSDAIANVSLNGVKNVSAFGATGSLATASATTVGRQRDGHSQFNRRFQDRELGEDRSRGRRLECEYSDRRDGRPEQLRHESESDVEYHQDSGERRRLPGRFRHQNPGAQHGVQRFVHLSNCRREPGRRLVGADRRGIDQRGARDAQHQQQPAGELDRRRE